jgi:hypothetical protein
MVEQTRTAGEWLAEVETERREETVLRQTKEGVFGLDTVVQDFDEKEIDRLRRIGAVIRSPERPGVRSAIALAGSAAQTKFQLFPGDCDFFERVHIVAPTREAALATLASVMIDTVGNVFAHPDLQFAEMKLGIHKTDARRGEEIFKAGTPVSWTLGDMDARSINAEDADGQSVVIEMGEVAENPGFVKLDWIFADKDKDRIVAVSKVIDGTWESPEGQIVALDGVLDSFYQEVYLDPESKPHVERLIDRATPSGLREYVEQLEKEIIKYSDPEHGNWGKVAKRLYNIFRITNRTQPAMFLRQLFDDPAARLYQIPPSLYALSQVLGKRHLAAETVGAQLDEMEDILKDTYTDTDLEDVIVKLRHIADTAEIERQEIIDELTEKANRQVSQYFEERLKEEPEIVGYIAMLRDEAPV